METQKSKSVTRESDKFMLRFPDGMRKRIAEDAARNGRSMNAEIVAILSAPVPAGETDLSAVPGGRLLDEVINRYGARVQIISDEAAQDVNVNPRKKSK